MMGVAVDQNGAIGAALAEGEIVNREDAGRRRFRDGDLASKAQQGIWTGWHGLTLALPSPRFAAKGQAELRQGGRQAAGALGSWGKQAGQGLGEGLGGAGRIATAPAPHVQQEAQRGADEREVMRPAGVVTMDMDRFSGTARAACGGLRCARGESNRTGVCVKLKNS